MAETDRTLKILTPEGIVFRYALAGPVLRSLAWAIDTACVFGVSGAAASLLQTAGWIHPDAARALTVLLYAVLSAGYPMYCEWYWRGQTIGKRTVGLRVIDAAGLHLRPFQVAIRNLMRFLDALPAFYLVGGIAAFWSRKGQRLGDVAAHTVVIRVSTVRQPDLEKIGRSKYNSLLAYPALCARLRQKTSAELASAALSALLRREEFEASARTQLFHEVLACFKTMVEFPEEVTDQISPEQTVRNIVEVLYASARRV